MTAKFLRSPIFLLVVGGIAIFVIAGGFWWTKVYQSPYNVYWGMLRNNLSTIGVTKQITQESGGTQLDQTLATTFGAQNSVHALTFLKTAKSTVNTETVGTPEQDAVRYTTVQTSQKPKVGKSFDFSSVLGKWASSKVQNDSSANAAAGLFMQTTLGVLGGNLLPQANLSATDRQDLLKRLHNEAIFDTSYTDVKKSNRGGRLIYTYKLKVEPVAYVGFEKAFATDLGLKQLDNIDPNSYQNEAPIEVNIDIDARSHQLVAVDYPGQSHHETYAGYGVTAPVGMPKATISGTDLRDLLSKIQ